MRRQRKAKWEERTPDDGPSCWFKRFGRGGLNVHVYLTNPQPTTYLLQVCAWGLEFYSDRFSAPDYTAAKRQAAPLLRRWRFQHIMERAALNEVFE